MLIHLGWASQFSKVRRSIGLNHLYVRDRRLPLTLDLYAAYTL